MAKSRASQPLSSEPSSPQDAFAHRAGAGVRTRGSRRVVRRSVVRSLTNVPVTLASHAHINRVHRMMSEPPPFPLLDGCESEPRHTNPKRKRGSPPQPAGPMLTPGSTHDNRQTAGNGPVFVALKGHEERSAWQCVPRQRSLSLGRKRACREVAVCSNSLLPTAHRPRPTLFRSRRPDPASKPAIRPCMGPSRGANAGVVRSSEGGDP